MLKNFLALQDNIALNSFFDKCKLSVQYYEELNKKHNMCFKGTFCLHFS